MSRPAPDIVDGLRNMCPDNGTITIVYDATNKDHVVHVDQGAKFATGVYHVSSEAPKLSPHRAAYLEKLAKEDPKGIFPLNAASRERYRLTDEDYEFLSLAVYPDT